MPCGRPDALRFGERHPSMPRRRFESVCDRREVAGTISPREHNSNCSPVGIQIAAMEFLRWTLNPLARRMSAPLLHRGRRLESLRCDAFPQDGLPGWLNRVVQASTTATRSDV